MSTFARARAVRDAFDTELIAAGEAMNQIRERLAGELGIAPRGPMGLTAEPIRLNPEYRAAKATSDALCDRLRRFNKTFTRVYAKEIRADRDARWAARLAAAKAENNSGN